MKNTNGKHLDWEVFHVKNGIPVFNSRFLLFAKIMAHGLTFVTGKFHDYARKGEDWI